LVGNEDLIIFAEQTKQKWGIHWWGVE